jgi:hypothetical protein
MLTVVQIAAGCAGRGSVWSVFQMAGSSCWMWLCAGVAGACERLSIVGCQPPNTPLQRTRVARRDPSYFRA